MSETQREGRKPHPPFVTLEEALASQRRLERAYRMLCAAVLELDVSPQMRHDLSALLTEVTDGPSR